MSLNQSGFRTRDSSINQALSVTHDIYCSFDEGFETKAIFLDISKVFDKFWHERLIYESSQYGFSDDLIMSVLTDFLTNKKRVDLIFQNS